MSSSTARVARSPAIDVIKGLAIVSVICLHTLTGSTLHRIGALFFIWQAVPVFVFLLGLNGARSLRRRGRALRELYSLEHVASRLDRVLLPFLLAFAGTVLVDLATSEHRGPATLLADLVTGQLPIGGPGNYFITLLFQLTVLMPLLVWALLRRPVATVLACLAVNAAFEQLAPHVGRLRTDPYLYEAGALRYLFLVALGGALAGVSAGLGRRWWLWLGALASAAFLALAQLDAPAIPFGLPGWENSSYAAAFYPAALVLLGMAAMSSYSPGALGRGVAELGRASYHIFLLQIVWFGLGVWRMGSPSALLGNLAVTLLAGVAFYRLMGSVPLPTASGFLARRRGAVIRRKLRLTS